MSIADKTTYTAGICDALALRWPDNHTVNLVCHGHSVPSGYACTPLVDTFHAYPHLVHRALKQRFPYAVLNVITTGVGGENAAEGAKRFEAEALNHRPALVTIDYSLNDRSIGLEAAQRAWRDMIEAALARDVKVMLLTPSWDQTWFAGDDQWRALEAHAEQVRALASEYGVALADSFAAFGRYIAQGGDLQDLLSHWNHPSETGHRLIAREITSWFVAR